VQKKAVAVLFAAACGAPVANAPIAPIAPVANAPAPSQPSPPPPAPPPPPPAQDQPHTIAVGSFALVADVPAAVESSERASLALLSWPDQDTVTVQQDDAPRAWKSTADAAAEAKWFQYPESTTETWPNGFGLLARAVTDGDKPIYLVSSYVHAGGHYYACSGASPSIERRDVMAAICRSIRTP
jgi:hypothetical protein